MRHYLSHGLRVAIALIAALAYGQQFNSGQITGFVLDPTGAGIPGARVTVVEGNTALERKISSDSAGFFVFADLPLGTYQVTAEHAGFKRAEVSGLVLDASGKVAVRLSLPIGNVADSIEIKASLALVESETAQIGRMVDQQQMLEIPVNGRNMGNFLMWVPGASNLRAPNNSAATDNFGIRRFSINGLNDSQTHVTVDGVEAIRTDGGGATIGMTSPDSLQEARILTSAYLAEYGRGGGAQAIYVTRSGTQQFHGSAYEYLENNALNARGYFTTSLPALRQNIFGGTVGGPVYVPKLWNTGHNKAFFFYSGEFLRIRNYTQAIGQVPTDPERAGNFAGTGTPAPLDPSIAAPFPNALIPKTRFSTNGPGLMNLFPEPNTNLPGGNFTQLGRNWTNQQIHQIKGDYNLPGTRISASINVTRLDFGNAFRGSFPLLPDLQHRYGYRYGLNATTTIRPNLLNEFQFGFSTDHEQLLRVGNGVDRTVYGINFPFLFPANLKDGNKIPTVNVSGMSLIDGGQYLSAGHRGPIFTLRDNITWIRGPHTFKFGAAFDRSGLNTSDQAQSDQGGSFTFAASSLNPRTSKNPIADVLLGNFDAYTEQGRSVFNVYRTNALELFAQDSWKISRDFSVEIGVRYNYWPPYYEIWNATAFFNPSFYNPAKAPQINPSNGQIVAGTGDPYNGIVLPGSGWPSGAQGRFEFASNPASAALFHNLPRGFANTQRNMFEPRIGFAWSPMRDTVIRGGIGIFHTRDVFYSFQSQGVNYPLAPVATVSYANVDNPAGGSSPPSFPPSVRDFDPNLKAPVIYQGSLGLQKTIRGNVLLDVGYVGQRTRDLYYSQPIGALPYDYCFQHLPTNCNAVQPYLGYASVSKYGNAQFANYNSLQISARRRYAQGLLVAANYTWSKNMERGSVRDPFNLNLDVGPSALNRAHVFNTEFVYELPFWKQNQQFIQRMLAGWEISGFAAFSTGLPMNVGILGNLAAAAGTATRPDMVGDPNVRGSQGTFYSFWNSAAFAQPAFGTLGNAGYNVLTGPGDNNWDLGILKNFHISRNSEGMRLQYRMEMFNAFNHAEVAYNGVNTQWGSPLFGHVTAMAASRVIQMALKFRL